MKTLSVTREQYLTDAKGKRTGVLLDLKTYERLRQAEQQLIDIHEYDAARDLAHSEIAAGEFVNLETYRASRKARAK